MRENRSGSRMVKALFVGYARGFGLALVVTVGALCLLGLLGLIAVPIARQLEVDGGMVLIGVLILWMLLCLAITLVVVIGMLVHRFRRLDAAFNPLGLSGRMYLTNGRQYHGTLQDRQVDVYFYRGPMLDIYVEAPLRTRAGIGTKDSLSRSIGRLIDRRTLRTSDPALEHLDVYALDEGWARELLRDPQARGPILRLTAASSSYGVRHVLVTPEALLLRLGYVRLGEVTPRNVQQWMEDLLALARAAEGLPAPMRTAEATDLERRSRSDRSAFFLPVLLILLAFFGLLGCISLVVALVLIGLSS